MEEFEKQIREKTKKTRTSTRLLTHNDEKILGQNTARKQEVVADNQKFHTNKMRTYASAWTPVVNKPANEQIFNERRDLISHWFDLWTNSQRKRFFAAVFQQCERPQYKFIQYWFQDHVPLQHLDFTTVLPKFLSLYIFSFLDPKSLCRSAQVSWHWKFLSEQDVVWMPKCLNYGWFLPYKAPDNEFGAWKKYYLGCVQTPDYRPALDIQETKPFQNQSASKKRKQPKSARGSGRMSPTSSSTAMKVRPPWVSASLKPNDLDKSFHAFLHGANANDPKLPKSALVYHNKWGIVRKNHELALSKSQNFDLGLGSTHRKEGHRIMTSGIDHDLQKSAQRKSLSEVMDLINLEEKRKKDLVDSPWNPPVEGNRTQMQWFGNDTLMSGYEAYPTSTEFRTLSRTLPLMGVDDHDHPRLVIISSRVPAADLLVDAVLFGVIPVVYEYEGTTAEALMMKLEKVLAGRTARSIGLFCHSQEPGELRLAHGCTVTMETLNRADVVDFFTKICRRHILPSDQGGQFDIFVPLAACEPGLEIVVQLSIRTELQFSSPTGIIGNYNHVNSDWLIPYKEGRPAKTLQPPHVYFCPSKLDVWSNVADQAMEALSSCKLHIGQFLEKTHRDIVSQLTGQLVFDVLGQTEIQGVKNVTNTLSEALVQLGKQENDVNALEFLGQYLLEKSGVDDLAFTSSLEKSLVPADHSEDEDEEVTRINGHGRTEDQEEVKADWGDPPPLDETSRHMDEENEDISQDKSLGETVRPPADMPEKAQMEQSEKEENRQQKQKRQRLVQQADNLRVTFGSMRLSGKYERLSAKQFHDHPEKRTPIAMEILSSEVEYNRTLQAVKDVYVKPLRAALNSNRAIASFQNVQIIFTDLLQLLDASSEMLADLKDRVAEWDATHSCMGDIFVRFCTHLKLYTNFVNNYDVILQCIERTKEQTPAFRAFLKRHERIPATRMMTLPELLLLPGRRINEYVTLLSWFELHTPSTHQDRADLADAIETLKVVNRHVQESKTRMDRDRRMIKLQKTILNCPSLLESNRYLVKQQDAANMKPPSTQSTIPELRVYQHIEMLGLFLFNDALVVTRRTDKNFPFTRAVEHTYRFESSLALSRLRVRDIPESKYIRYGFKLETPKRALHCAVETEEEKFNWISLLEQAIRSAIDI
ncbi:epithelial cell-transforming sequence 2 oncogene-like isoform X2 [Ostrea edulis]|uniref:epithelial cell-transforming sequence 2 oncogene-like isoform X2 n=1 Tax=Ostrea edulis TaxID=37623 RepID=UPI0024AFCCD9|nr:epithelial cell-transforming sequence 2 oncogene-like isoform X2 [Ostrea edulis]